MNNEAIRDKKTTDDGVEDAVPGGRVTVVVTRQLGYGDSVIRNDTNALMALVSPPHLELLSRGDAGERHESVRARLKIPQLTRRDCVNKAIGFSFGLPRLGALYYRSGMLRMVFRLHTQEG